MTPKGNSRANGISERESNNEANCEADCNIARHNLAGALSVGGDGGRKSPEHFRATLTCRCGTERLPNNSLLLAGPVHTPTPGRGGAWQMGSPAETFFGQRELNFSAGRRIGGRLSEIFPQIPPETVQVPGGTEEEKPIPPGRRGPPSRAGRLRERIISSQLVARISGGSRYRALVHNAARPLACNRAAL